VMPLSAAFVDGGHVEAIYPQHRELRTWPSWGVLEHVRAEPAAVPYDELAGQIMQALGGQVVSIPAGPAGLAAALWTQDSFPPWYHVVIWSGSLQAMTPSQVRIWGNPCWSASGVLAVTAFDGIRRGIVTIDPGDGRTRWWSRPASSSYRLLALAPGGQDALAVRSDHDGSAWLVRAGRGGTDDGLQMLRPADAVPVSVITWAHDGIGLEGLLAAAPGAAPQRLLVLLHGGPVSGLACSEHPDPSAWVSAGFAVFMPDFRASGIAGNRLMTEAFRRPWLSAADPEADDVLTGVDMLIADGTADPRALFLLGHSHGGYLAGRILARDHRFAAAACCDAVADLRLLDPESRQKQAAWLGGDPGQSPGRWAAASPVEYAGDIRTPVLLAYSAGSGLAVHGKAWQAALSTTRAAHKLIILDEADHVFSSGQAQRRLHQEVTDWFEHARHPRNAGSARSITPRAAPDQRRHGTAARPLLRHLGAVLDKPAGPLRP
jgi:dipeptidyl aminopeptidase/acylaminoacyl peptidase